MVEDAAAAVSGQQQSGGDGASTRARLLAGLRAWIITDGKTGMEVQARGVAEALQLDFEMMTVSPTGIHGWLAPWGGVAPSERFGKTGAQFAPPWPDIVISTGRSSIPYIQAVGRQAGLATYRVILQDPKVGPKVADLIWVPEHDRRRGPNVITTLTAPHGFTQSRIAAARAQIPAKIASLPSPRVAVILGGKNAVYRFTEADDDRFRASLESLAGLGASFMITPSRRTHKRLMKAAMDATSNAARIVHDGDGENPYADFLCAADILIVTADSVNMTGEAAATGRPVYVFEPSGGSAKFARFHGALRHYGATRPLPDRVTTLPDWSYEPLDSAARIAAEIEARWLRRRTMLPGLSGACR